ncbi:MAG: adenylate/guanylate cyclase domain-containing protein, partial [Motiliproteus sp.]|nr:adenylate/guanylate cyclase domain-containing protein [Motiliproteus sp.]
LRQNRIPHASVCGGRGRCTTCRIRIDLGIEQLPEPGKLEQEALQRIEAAPNVRLACQSRPHGTVKITPLLPPDLILASHSQQGGVNGEERPILAMFIDLRDSTRLGEQRLPYDVLFILNRFFLEMSEALKESHGHYAQFAGDGLMALYGLERGLKQGGLDALRGAVDMQQRIDRLNEELKNELAEPLRIGIGLHCGEAIVGTMGPPSSPNYSAIGDNINAAARLESQTKVLGCTLVVSERVAQASELNLNRFPKQQVSLKGKDEQLWVYAISDTAALESLFNGP